MQNPAVTLKNVLYANWGLADPGKDSISWGSEINRANPNWQVAIRHISDDRIPMAVDGQTDVRALYIIEYFHRPVYPADLKPTDKKTTLDAEVAKVWAVREEIVRILQTYGRSLTDLTEAFFDGERDLSSWGDDPPYLHGAVRTLCQYLKTP